MGACYSKTGHEVENLKKKSPHGKKHKNGISLTIEYSPVRSPEQEEDKLSIFAQEEEAGNCEQIKSNGNIDKNEKHSDVTKVVNGGEEPSLHSSNQISKNISQVSRSKSGHSGQKTFKVREFSEVVTDTSDRGTSSDSGVESLTRLDNSASTHSSQSNCDKNVDNCKLSSVTEFIGSPGANSSWRSEHGEFPSPSHKNRFSDLFFLKSSLKRPGQNYDRRNTRLSWKSSDSLDWTATLTNSLDRCRSEASEFFFEDFDITAPLATFDSVGYLGSVGSLLQNRRSRASFVDYNTDTFQFQFDFSGLESDTGDGTSNPTSPAHSLLRQNSVHVDNVLLEMSGSKRASQELRHFDSEASLELASSLPRLQDVKTMQIDGKEVVVIDVETYTSVMEELSMLKMKLSQLTDFLQEQDLIQLETSRERSDLSFSSQRLDSVSVMSDKNNVVHSTQDLDSTSGVPDSSNNLS